VETESPIEEQEALAEHDAPEEATAVEPQVVTEVPPNAKEAEATVEPEPAPASPPEPLAEATAVVPSATDDEWQMQIASLRDELAVARQMGEELKAQLASQKDGELKRFKSLSGSIEALKKENQTLKRLCLAAFLVALVGCLL